MYHFYAKQALNAQILTKNKPQMKNSYGTYSKMISCAKINNFKRKINKKDWTYYVTFLSSCVKALSLQIVYASIQKTLRFLSLKKLTLVKIYIE